jgi:LytS/YehU family sensor histidine kinase
MYFIFPYSLQKKKYLPFFILMLTSYAFFNLIDFYMAELFFKATCNCDVKKLNPLFVFTYGNNNAFLAVAIGCIATGIKFAKGWYIQRKQVLEIKNQKIKKELQALTRNIHPDFIFHSLNSLETNIKAGSDVSADMILKFSDILSYVLYDCDTDVVLLKDELKTVREYLLLEQIKMKGLFAVHFKQEGEIKSDFIIVPSLLLSFLQNCFALIYEQDNSQVNVEIDIKENYLDLYLSIHQPVSLENPELNWHKILDDFRVRLQKFYPARHILETTFITDCQILTTLKLALSERSKHILKSDPDQLKAGIYETI